jgi:hypothetical protein
MEHRLDFDAPALSEALAGSSLALNTLPSRLLNENSKTAPRILGANWWTTYVYRNDQRLIPSSDKERESHDQCVDINARIPTVSGVPVGTHVSGTAKEMMSPIRSATESSRAFVDVFDVAPGPGKKPSERHPLLLQAAKTKPRWTCEPAGPSLLYNREKPLRWSGTAILSLSARDGRRIGSASRRAPCLGNPPRRAN